MRGPYLFPVLRGQKVTALRVCDAATVPSDGSLSFGAIALQCERHALLCYCPVRYLLYPHGSTFGRWGGTTAALPFRATLCEVEDLEDWLPLTAGAHWSHHVASTPCPVGKVLAEAPQMVKAEDAANWRLAFRFTGKGQLLLSRIAECNRLQFVPAEADWAG